MVSPAVFVAVSLGFFAATPPGGTVHLESDREHGVLGYHDYDAINGIARTWKAGMNFGPDTPLKYIIGLLGSKGVRTARPGSRLESAVPSDGVTPYEFDARTIWKKCTIIGAVHDQGNCGCCWAFSTVGAFADRLCIATDGEFNRILSAEQLTFCCNNCGNGCNGGYPIRAWRYFRRHGVVTGGDYDSNEGCQPYRVRPCGGFNTCDDETEENHECSIQCYGDNTIDYNSDHRYAKNSYYLDYSDIQKDIMKYGPNEASFEVYDDFIHYKSGVYTRTAGSSYLGGHSVKCIGWGEEDGLPYWLMVNSWNETWGDAGLFKIRRGSNECKVDDSFTAGVPNI